MVEIQLNGSPLEIEPGETILDLLARFDLDARWVVAEHNGNPVGRERFAAVQLSDGDRVELVRAVAGG